MRWSFALASMLVLLSSAVRARAAPPRAPDAEERLADRDLDAEDLVARSGGGGGGAGGRARGDRDVSRGAPGGRAWISLVGFTRPTPGGAHEEGAMLVVGLPFDRIARAGTRAALAEPPTTPPPRPSDPRPAPPVPAPTPPQPPPQPEVEAEPVLALTPRVARACVSAAWRASGLGADDARVDAIVSRARWSGVLPEARLRVIRWDDERLTADAPDRLRDATGANLGLEARLTWRLDRLLFAEDEPSFERIRLERQDARARVAGRALEALFHWQRAWLGLRAAPKGSREETEDALREMEAAATLDVLTAGWFSVWRSQGRREGP